MRSGSIIIIIRATSIQYKLFVRHGMSGSIEAESTLEVSEVVVSVEDTSEDDEDDPDPDESAVSFGVVEQAAKKNTKVALVSNFIIIQKFSRCVISLKCFELINIFFVNSYVFFIKKSLFSIKLMH